jgi:MFS transporter, FSR family, fosmidomycin resistance protein
MDFLFSTSCKNIFYLNLLHFFNDGFEASFILLLPFIARDLDISLTQVGILGTTTNIFRILLALPAAYIATKFGGLRALLLAILIYGCGYLGASFSHTFPLMIVMFMIGGIGYGIFHPVGFSLMARWSPKHVRGKQMGNFTAVGDLGRIVLTTSLIPIIVLTGWRWTTAFYALLIFSTCAIFHFCVFKKDKHIFSFPNAKIKKVSFAKIIFHKKFIYAMSASMLDALASSALFLFFPFLLIKRGIDPVFLTSFTAAFLVGTFAGKTILGRFVDAHGIVKVFILSEILMAIFIFLVANSQSLVLIIVCSIILGAFTKGTVPVVQIMITEAVDHHENYEKAFSVASFFATIGLAIAPILLGVISDRLGITMAFNAMACFALLATLPALAFQFSKSQK